MIEADFTTREFPMTDRDFYQIKTVAYRLTGINLTSHKKNMVYGRLVRRMRCLGLNQFSDYCSLLSEDNSDEHVGFVNAITTNLTSFFREKHHFDYLKNTCFPHILQKNVDTRRLRIWSAGCSTGEEAYSIAMVIKSIPAFSQWDAKILATDLDSNVVAQAKQGVYSQERAESVPECYRKWLSRNTKNSYVKVKEGVRELVTFNELNLLNSWPMKRNFDIIFCRNVIIYFDLDTQRTLFDRYANTLDDEGYLFIGHSENLHNVCKRFKSLGRTIYKNLH